MSTSTSSSQGEHLTEQQRSRIEQNRRKALELRALKNNGQVQGNVKAPPPVLPPSTTPTTITPKPTMPSHPQNFYNQNQNKPPASSKSISGICSLISRERFKLDIPYHAVAVAVMKSISGAQYDPKTRIWNFPISEHANLLSAMECLKPSVVFGGLPSYVLKAFKNQPQIMAEVDLSQIDPVLIRALMPFQKDGVIFGIRRNGRVLIADDMGLGKTIQALGIAHYYLLEWPLLIVAPPSMRYRWRESIWEWLPSVPAGSIYIMESGRDEFGSSKVVIVSYELLQKRLEEFCRFKVVIIDESHHLKNFKTARTKAALPILQNSKRALLLSGTPALSRPQELYPQLSALNRYLISYENFGVRYCNGKKNAWGWDFAGSSNMQELNLLLEETVMIRRLKSDVLKQLPPKLRKLVILDPAQIKLTSTALLAKAEAFQETKTLRMAEVEKRKRLLEYYSESSMVKLPAVNAYIRDKIEEEKKFLVFAHHKTLMDGICDYLNEAKCKYIRIDGGSNSEDRQFCVEQFQSRPDIRVAVLSIMAANSGITLTAAGLVIFAELYWNPGILTQAEDRAHRIGQEDSVVVEYLLAKGTSDDVLWPMIQAKLDVLNKAGLSKDNFQDAEATGHTINAKDLMDTTPEPNLSQSSKSQKQIKDYFTKTEPKNADNVDDDNAFEMSAEDDAILMQLMNDW